MKIDAHVQALEFKCKQIDNALHECRAHCAVDDAYVTQLKRQKLQIQDEIRNLLKKGRENGFMNEGSHPTGRKLCFFKKPCSSKR